MAARAATNSQSVLRRWVRWVAPLLDTPRTYHAHLVPIKRRGPVGAEPNVVHGIPPTATNTSTAGTGMLKCSPLDAPPVSMRLPTKSGVAPTTPALVAELNAPV